MACIYVTISLVFALCIFAHTFVGDDYIKLYVMVIYMRAI